jgi:hypothetical protein
LPRGASATRCVKKTGAEGLHFHDLRHTGNTLAAMTGAPPRALMSRIGHDSMRAALIRQHRTQGADKKIANAMEALLAKREDEAKGDDEDPTTARPALRSRHVSCTTTSGTLDAHRPWSGHVP